MNARPAIKTKIANMAEYDTIYLGYPNWWGSYPMSIATFAESYNLEGKSIALFCTHGGGGVQRCESDFKKLVPNANYAPSLVLDGSTVKNSQGEISSWVKSLKF